MISYLQYIGGVFLGWSLGANDSANVFGTAVSSGMVRYRLAVLFTALFVILGAVYQGAAGIETYSRKLRKSSSIVQSEENCEKSEHFQSSVMMKKSMIISIAAAFTVTLMTIFKIPVSTSQAVVGAIIGVGLIQHDVNFLSLGKVITCWFLTPVGGAMFTLIFYSIFKKIHNLWKPSIFIYDPVVTFLLIVCGCYGAYALGANNVANVSGIFVGPGLLTVNQAAIGGGVAIAFGAVTFSKPVMTTVGKGIVKLDSFTALVCVLSHAVTVHIFAIIGVPVSTSQAIIGAVLGIGFIKGAHTVNYRSLLKVCSGWLATPVIASIFSAAAYYMAHMKYVPNS